VVVARAGSAGVEANLDGYGQPEAPQLRGWGEKTTRQGVLQKEADELLGRHSHHLAERVAVAGPGEGDLAIIESEQFQGVAERAGCAAPKKGRVVEVMRRCRREISIVWLYCKPKSGAPTVR